jgi:hypothetical protein
MNVEIGAEAALFPEKEYINGITVAVHAVFPGLVTRPEHNCPHPFGNMHFKIVDENYMHSLLCITGL